MVHGGARATPRVSGRVGRVGYLARELLAELPGVATEIGS